MTTRRPGRPRSVDVAVVARLAVDLFTERGYDAVSMDDVAAAAGVSRRSLFNHFPRKVDLLWSGHEQFIDHLRRRLAEAQAEAQAGDLAEVVAIAFSRALDDLGPDGLALARARLRLHAEPTEESLVVGQVVVSASRAAVLSHLEQHVDDDLARRALAGGMVAAVHESVLLWAAGDDPTPGPTVRAGIAALVTPPPHGGQAPR